MDWGILLWLGLEDRLKYFRKLCTGANTNLLLICFRIFAAQPMQMLSPNLKRCYCTALGILKSCIYLETIKEWKRKQWNNNNRTSKAISLERLERNMKNNACLKCECGKYKEHEIEGLEDEIKANNTHSHPLWSASHTQVSTCLLKAVRALSMAVDYYHFFTSLCFASWITTQTHTLTYSHRCQLRVK